MTELTHTVRRRTCRPAEQGRRLVVALEPGDVIAIRPERTRRWYRLPLEAVYSLAVKAETRAAARPQRGGRSVKRGMLAGGH